MKSFFCENYSEIIISFIGAFLGFGLALLIEYWALWRNKRKENKDNSEEMKKKIEYYTFLLKEVVSKTEKQIELIREYIHEQTNNPLTPLPLHRIPMNFFIRLKNIDNRGVFEALANKFKSNQEWIKRYNNLNSYTDFLEGTLTEELFRINNSTIEKGFQDQLFIKNLIDDIPNVLSKEAFKKMNELRERRFEDDEYNFINNTIGKYRQLADERAELGRFNTELLEPLLSSITPYDTQPYASEIIFKCKNARVRMNDIANDIKHTISTYETIINAVAEPISKVKEMIEEISQN